ncbi:MAG: Mrp/NBP35 family ATP-binding protein [Fimbriimonadaceae bacterium]|nr:Mrp/NBP35 family ATP-binding protein [Fimbriimonadaceae bacterium]
MVVTEAAVLDALRAVKDPDLHRDIVTLGFVKELDIDHGSVAFTIELTTPACPVKDQLRDQADTAVRAVRGVTDVRIEMTAQVRPRTPSPEELLPNVKHVIAIASGKGGVGKSTVSCNLAIALGEKGAKVGLMDADVYGPSIPLMMGAVGERPMTRNERIVPIARYGIQMMSLGFLLEEGQAVLWRGPMVAGTVKQLLTDVDWGDLDYLLVDLPPGTGDAPMSLAQLAPLTGVVIVTTPHHVAANIAGKSVQLFRRLNSPILGVIENMSLFVCPNCNETTRIFHGASGEDMAKEFKVPFLGAIPLDPAISEASDEGVPSLVAHPLRPQAEAFRHIAGELARQASIRAHARK